MPSSALRKFVLVHTAGGGHVPNVWSTTPLFMHENILNKGNMCCRLMFQDKALFANKVQIASISHPPPLTFRQLQRMHHFMSRSAHAGKRSLWPIRVCFSRFEQKLCRGEKRRYLAFTHFHAYKLNNEKGFSIYHTTSPPQTTHTLNLSIWVSLFIFSKTTYPVAYLPQNKDLGQTIFSFPSMS